MSTARKGQGGTEERKVRYGVVGLGWFSQVAILPAFQHGARNSELVALFSGKEEKLEVLGDRHGAAGRYTYDDYDDVLDSGALDAVYLALPNHLHAEYAVRAAKAGVHVLCEKPMAVTEAECREMISATDDGGVKLMIAYRLHFEEANLRAIELVNSGAIGEPRFFNAVFASQVDDEDDIRLNPIEKGGGTLYDIGIYCINAARYIFRAEPLCVSAFSSEELDERFEKADEMTAAVLRFPGDRLAAFVSSFSGADHDSYSIHGTEGHLTVQPAFEFDETLVHHLSRNGATKEERFPRRDQVAPEILHFSDCIIEDRQPEPSGKEGLADVQVIEALYRSARTGKPVALDVLEPDERPSLEQEVQRPPVERQELV
jgi:glucose-fructose oxidoreductase